MKYLILSFYVMLFGIILENEVNASGKIVPRIRSESALTDQDLHEGFFKSARLGTQEFTLNRIANLPEIFRCGTPIEQSRIVNMLNEMDGALSGIIGVFNDTISYLQELNIKKNEDTIAQIQIFIDGALSTKSQIYSSLPPTINFMVANLSAISGYLRVCQGHLLKHLENLSKRIELKTKDFLTRNASLPLNCISSHSIQQLKNELETLENLRNTVSHTINGLNKYDDMNQSFLLILSDFYLQPRNPEAAKTCSTDQYLGYLNLSIVGDDIVRLNRSESVH